ncbi:hypothetical protein ACTA71_002455 [Dictyostelium dimigraforme]
MKIIKCFIILISFLVITCSLYLYKISDNKVFNILNGSSNSGSGSSEYGFFQANQEIKKQDYCGLEPINFARLNNDLLSRKNDVLVDIIVGDRDIKKIGDIGLDSFKCSLEFNEIYLSPSNIWNVLILGLNKLVKPMEFSSFIENSQPTLILKNSVFNNNNSNDQIETILIDEISKIINPTFKELILPNFHSSPPSSKDQLIFLTNLIGKRNGIYDYGNIDCKIPSCYVNNSLPKNIYILGTIGDYEKMLINIKSIYNLLNEDLNLNSTSFKLFEWYSKNTFIIESIIKNLEDKSYKSMDLNYFINEFDASNDFIRNFGHERGFSYIPIQIIDENNSISYPNGTKINLFAGHFGSNVILQKSISAGLAIVEPQINWAITKYQTIY